VRAHGTLALHLGALPYRLKNALDLRSDVQSRSENRMKAWAAMLLLLPLCACAGPGTFERAGENADDAIGNVRDGVGDVADDVRDDVERSRRRSRR
jgi:hypothetical protein